MTTKRLDKFRPCSDAREWMRTQKNATEAWNNCERGDWMLWIAKKLNADDRKLTMAKAMCTKQVEHLMEDQRSKDAIQACIYYFNGLITREQLNAAAAAADAAAAYAAYAAAYADAALMNSLKRSADICREYLTEEVMAKYRRLR